MENDEERQRKEREKQERIEMSLRERSKEVKEQLSKYKSETERERDQLKREEAIDCFKALLIDLIKPNTTVEKVITAVENNVSTMTGVEAKNNEIKTSDHRHHKSSELTWKEAKKILKKDARWSHCKLVEKDKKEQLFDDHMAKFRAKKRELFYQLLTDTQGIIMKQTTWKEAKKLIKSDPRYEKLSSNESFKLEKEYETFMNEKYHKARVEFRVIFLNVYLLLFLNKTNQQNI